MAVIGAILGDIAGSQFEFDRPKDLDWKHCELFTDQCEFTDESFMRNVFRLPCDSDTIGAIGGAVTEEYYHGFGFSADEILERYLDESLMEILKK